MNIISYITGATLWASEKLTTRDAVEEAVAARANLSGADLSGANLNVADLSGANLSGANLSGASLTSAKWTDDATLVGPRPILMIAPIGSEQGTLVAAMTDKGVMVRRGCYSGALEEFVARVEEVHGDTNHGREYHTAIEMIRAHAVIWGGK